jgi:ribonuclease HI
MTLIHVKKFTTVQRIAMKAILGCYRTTPTAAMEMETDLPPTWIRLQIKVLLSVTRLQSLSIHHSIHTWIADALRTRTVTIAHRSSLGTVFNQFPFMCTKMENIEPFIRAPWYTPSAEIQLVGDKETAKVLHHNLVTNKSRSTMMIYTDGSGIDEKIGAALYDKSNNKTLHQHLGSKDKYNVYSAELTALSLGIAQWRSNIQSYPECYIFTDSQAACGSIAKPGRQSGQDIIRNILNESDHLTSQYNCHLTIIWIPGHVEIEGNERADTEAKHAALTPATDAKFKHLPLKSCRAQQIKTMAKEQWTATWTRNKETAQHLKRIATKPGVKTGSKLYNCLPNRTACAQIAQLRTGHCGLNKYLHRFKKRDDPKCECGRVETVEHFLMECHRYVEQRNELRKSVGLGRMNVARLLGDINAVKDTVKYIGATRRMEEQ